MHHVRSPSAIELRGNLPVELINGNEEGKFLLLQGKPIDESVVQCGTFVMNTLSEIVQAMADHRRTRFGGWPWEKDAWCMDEIPRDLPGTTTDVRSIYPG